MSEKRFKLLDETIFDNQKQAEDGGRVTYWLVEYQQRQELVDLLNEQEQKIQRWKKLYELKDAEVTARVDGLNKVCNYYLTEAQFKGDTDPNDAVKEVINAILNAPIYEE